MAERSGFFNSKSGDRKYDATFFSDFFSGMLTSGIYNGGTNLLVSNSSDDMKSEIWAGKAFINGYFYYNDATLSLTHSTAHPLLDRIDRVVLRLDIGEVSRNISALIIEGLPASSPIAPELTRSGSIYEISLARVLIPHGSSVIPSINITDERLNSNVCGLINSLIKVDTTIMQQQFDAFMDTLEGQSYAGQSELNELAGLGRTTETVKANADAISQAFSSIANLNSDILTKIPLSQKGAASGVATLNSSSKVDDSQLPLDYSFGNVSLAIPNIPARSSSTYSYVTVSFPVPANTKELWMNVDGAYIHLVKDANTAEIHPYSQYWGIPNFKIVNRGYGITGTTVNPEVLSILTIWTDYTRLIDAYISDNNVYLKITSSHSSTVATGHTAKVNYMIRS